MPSSPVDCVLGFEGSIHGVCGIENRDDAFVKIDNGYKTFFEKTGMNKAIIFRSFVPEIYFSGKDRVTFDLGESGYATTLPIDKHSKMVCSGYMVSEGFLKSDYFQRMFQTRNERMLEDGESLYLSEVLKNGKRFYKVLSDTRYGDKGVPTCEMCPFNRTDEVELKKLVEISKKL
jgi:hypothetical protein